MTIPATSTDAPPVGGGRVPNHGKFDGLQVGRGFAAMAVLISHAATIITEPRFYGMSLLDGRLGKLGAGVDFFFVLSGFIITWAHWGDIGHPDRLRNYAFKRFSRIYPPYWVILVPLAIAYILAPGSGTPTQHDPLNLFFSLTLLPYPEPPILGVAWTLVYEMIFYLVFAAIILRGRPAFALLWIWGAAILIAGLDGATLRFPFTILLDSLNLEFLMGVAAAVCLRRMRIAMPVPLAVLGFGSFLVLVAIPFPVAADPLLMRIGFGLSASMGILGLVEQERSQGFATPRLLRLLGGASYAIYLIHGVAISITIQLLVRIAPRTLPLPLVVAALFVAGVAAGILFHLFVEKPLARRLARRRSQATPAPMPEGMRP